MEDDGAASRYTREAVNDFPPQQPRSPDEVARRQMQLEQLQMEAQLGILQTRRQQRESAVNRRWTFFLVFALSGGVAYVLDRSGQKPEVSIMGCVFTIVVVSAWWIYRKPF